MIDLMNDTLIHQITRQIKERRVTLRLPGMDETTHKLLEHAFNQICSKEHWKGPINAVVPSRIASVYVEAIRFYTATEPVQLAVDAEHVRLVSVGYWAGPAA